MENGVWFLEGHVDTKYIEEFSFSGRESRFLAGRRAGQRPRLFEY